MKAALNPVTLSPDLPFADFVQIAGEAGFEGVEFSMEVAAGHADEHGVEGLRSLFEGAGVGPAQWRLGLPLWQFGEDGAGALAL